jgi:hypothetical protein
MFKMDSRFASFCFAKCLLKPFRGNDGGGFLGLLSPCATPSNAIKAGVVGEDCLRLKAEFRSRPT